MEIIQKGVEWALVVAIESYSRWECFIHLVNRQYDHLSLQYTKYICLCNNLLANKCLIYPLLGFFLNCVSATWSSIYVILFGNDILHNNLCASSLLCWKHDHLLWVSFQLNMSTYDHWWVLMQTNTMLSNYVLLFGIVHAATIHMGSQAWGIS